MVHRKGDNKKLITAIAKATFSDASLESSRPVKDVDVGLVAVVFKKGDKI